MFMKPDDLHCMPRMNETGQIDLEKNWFKKGQESELLSSSMLYWNDEMCASVVTKFFHVHWLPTHVTGQISSQERDRFRPMDNGLLIRSQKDKQRRMNAMLILAKHIQICEFIH